MEEIKNNYPLVNDNGVTREMTEEEYAEYTAFISQLTSQASEEKVSE